MSINEQLKSLYITIAAKAYSDGSVTTAYREVTHAQLAITLGVSLSVLLFIWILFEYLAKHNTTRSVYRQRLFHPRCIELSKSGRDNRNFPSDQSWMGSVIFGTLRFPESDLPGLMGIGGYLSYRIMRHCLYFSILAVCYCGLVLLPVYLSQHGYSARDKPFLGMIVANNISDNNPSHTWVLVISSYLLCAYWCIVLHFEWQIVKQMQFTFEHDNRSTNKQVYYSILVEGTSKSDMQSIRQGLPLLVGKTAEEVYSIVTVPIADKLHSLDRRLFWYSLLPSFLFFRSTKQDTLSELNRKRSMEIDRLREMTESGTTPEVRSIRKRGSSMEELGNFESSSPEKSIGITTTRTTTSAVTNLISLFVTRRVNVYFVTFWCPSTKLLLSLIYDRRDALEDDTTALSLSRIVAAPPPTDIIWANITVPTRILRNRQLFVRIMLVLVAIGYAYPISRIQDFAKMDSTGLSAEEVGFGTSLWFRQILSIYVPAIIQLVLTQMIPIVLRFISKEYERRKTYQDVSRYVLHRSFLFQLLTVYVIVFGDLWGDVFKLSGGVMYFYNSMVMRFRRLGNEIPPVGHYFASTIIVALLTEVGIQMLNPLQLLVNSSKSRFQGTNSSWTNSKLIQYKYSSSYSFILLLVNIMFTFCLIAPVVMIYSFIFWAFNQAWTKYALIFLNNRRYEVGTAFSPVIFSAFATSLLISQISVFIVLLSMDSGKWDDHINAQVVTTGILVLLVLIYKYIIMRNFFLQQNQAFEIGQYLQKADGESREAIASGFSMSFYILPELKGTDSVRSDNKDDLVSESEKQSLIRNNEDP